MAALALKLVAGVVILVVGLQVAAWARTFTARAVQRRGAEGKPETGRSLVAHTAGVLVYWALLFLVVLLLLGTLGVEVTGVIAIAGTLGLAVGLALQGALTDVAAGLILGATGRYSMGDLITTNGVTGTVVRFSLLTTVLLEEGTEAPVTLPNSKVYGAVLVSVASQWDKPQRTARVIVTVANSNRDLGPAFLAVKAAVAALPRVLARPPVTVGVVAVTAQGTNVGVRFSLHPDDMRIKDNSSLVGVVTALVRATLVAQGVRLASCAAPPAA